MSIDFDHALDILRNHNNFISERDRAVRDVLIAAIDNLIEFAAAEEYSMMRELPENLNDDLYDEYESICRRYNLNWATIENQDVIYAASMAAWWIGLSSETILTFMTQGDERVRPWHEALEGLSYLKRDFPPELIPPIEYGCRCFLVADGFGSVMGSVRREQAGNVTHPVFQESLCVGGRIFSSEHPYFKTPLPPQICKIVDEIKQKFYLV